MMRVKTLIAAEDTAYTEHISEYISEYHADTMEISVCSTIAQLRKSLSSRRYDVALMDETLIGEADLTSVTLPLLLWTGKEAASSNGEPQPQARYVKKHKRISSIMADVLEHYAAAAGSGYISGETEGTVTAVWSPSGGVGKTTVALAYATSRAAKEKDVFYLNMEFFTASPVYLSEKGKSISAVFEMLENNTGNIKILIQAMQSNENGIKYLCAPNNFDDICILSAENIRELVTCCAEVTGELVIDMSCMCDSRTRQIFELADKILLVTDPTDTARIKLTQFISQSNVYEGIKEKLVLVVNESEALTEADKDLMKATASVETAIFLPSVSERNAQTVYGTLAKHM